MLVAHTVYLVGRTVTVRVYLPSVRLCPSLNVRLSGLGYHDPSTTVLRAVWPPLDRAVSIRPSSFFHARVPHLTLTPARSEFSSPNSSSPSKKPQTGARTTSDSTPIRAPRPLTWRRTRPSVGRSAWCSSRAGMSMSGSNPRLPRSPTAARAHSGKRSASRL